MINLGAIYGLAIGQHTQALNNCFDDLYGDFTGRYNSKITTRNYLNTTKRWKLTQAIQRVKSFFLACYEDLFLISIQSKSIFSVETLLETCRVFRHVRQDFLGVITQVQKRYFDDSWTNTRARARRVLFFRFI